MSRLIFVNRVCWPDEEATAQLLGDLVSELSRLGWDCHVVTASSGPNRQNCDAGRPITYHRIAPNAAERATGLFDKALRYRRFAREAKRYVHRLAAPGDVVIAKTDPPLLGVQLANALRGRPISLWHWAQDIYPEVAIALAGRPWLAAALRRFTPGRNRAWRESEHIITLGSDMVNLIQRNIGEATPVTIIPNWYPSTAEAPRHQDFRKHWHVRDDQLLVMYSGNLGRAHILDPILNLAAATRDESRLLYQIVGHGAQESHLRELVAQRQLTNVRFSPPVARADLDASLAAADVHLVTMRPACRGTVMPSKFYGIIAAHRPCLFIGPTESDLARTIADHELGASCAPQNITPALNYLRSIAASPENLQRAGKKVATYAALLPDATGIAVQWDQALRRHHHSPNSLPS